MLPSIQISLILLFSFILKVQGGSYWSEMHQKTRDVKKGRKVYKEVMDYCETRTPEGMSSGLMLFKGSHVKFRNCYVCDCGDDGLTCKTSYGLMLFGHMQCKTVIDDCEPLLVDKYHNNLRCYSKLPLDKPVPKTGYHEIKVGNIFG
ncbi:uncharacterized protein LOC132721392 [Ruditapes philippinarum]|uniref:uncharacterized protein LOC132721392 n=1 Tax=Ruditapes philippinarum TaxID=129788 RepID=UPI00295B8CFA|nr:uncharacterized protein LOC132721392 [Ruditapes philippinarum]